MSSTCGMPASIPRLSRPYNPQEIGPVVATAQRVAGVSLSTRVPSSRKGRPGWRAIAAGLALSLAAFAFGYARTAPARAAITVRPSHRGLYRDGTFSGWGRSPHGRILATVTIRRGRIASVEITTCRMRYPCSMIAALPGQVVARQGPDVDIVSGATQSGDAFAGAGSQALAQAVREGREP